MFKLAKEYLLARLRILVTPVIEEAIQAGGEEFFEALSEREGDKALDEILTALHPEGKVRVTYSTSGADWPNQFHIHFRKDPVSGEFSDHDYALLGVKFEASPKRPPKVGIHLRLKTDLRKPVYLLFKAWTNGVPMEELPEALVKTADELSEDVLTWARGFRDWVKRVRAAWEKSPDYRKLKGLSEIQELG